MIGCPTWLMLPGHAQNFFLHSPPTLSISLHLSRWLLVNLIRPQKKQEIPTKLIWRLWFSTRWNCYLPFHCIENATENRHVHFLSHPCFLILVELFTPVRRETFLSFSIFFFLLYEFLDIFAHITILYCAVSKKLTSWILLWGFINLWYFKEVSSKILQHEMIL